MLQRLSEFHRSTWECVISLAFILGPFLGNLVHCAYQMSIGNGLLQYRLGFIEVSKYLGASASYQDVLILNVCAVVAILVGVVLNVSMTIEDLTNITAVIREYCYIK